MKAFVTYEGFKDSICKEVTTVINNSSNLSAEWERSLTHKQVTHRPIIFEPTSYWLMGSRRAQTLVPTSPPLEAAARIHHT